MNYVERHFGDWARDTAHLSMLEDGAYNRLCDLYYTREEPLPIDLDACCRLARATSKNERAAVSSVLREFFTKTDDGWRHKRCDAEIERYQIKTLKARASAQKRWTHTEPHSEGNANASADAMRTHSEGNAPKHQTPNTNTQTPRKRKEGRGTRAVMVGSAELEADGLPPELAAEWLEHRRRKGAHLTPAGWKGIKAEAEKAGISPADAVRKALARGWIGFEAAWVSNGNGVMPLRRMTGSEKVREAEAMLFVGNDETDRVQALR
jgi:uncharacterized protein YdaU (DUF1376 family)